MKTFFSSGGLPARRARRGFTLIEMLVVIAIIGLLAAIIVPLAGVAARKRIISRTQIELNNVDLAINMYKAKRGFFPPDNTNTPAGAFTNQLFYELWGMVQQSPPVVGNQIFTNTFNAHEIVDSQTLSAFFGQGSTGPKIGVLNSSADTNEVLNFIPRLKAAQIQNINPAGQYPVWVFAVPSPGPTANLPVVGGQPVNVIRYVSSNPTNNPSTFDLWVDVIIAGKTNRISNWSKDPQIVNN